MIKWVLKKIVGSKNEREIKKMRPIIAEINELEEAYQKESEEKILAKVKTWQRHLHRYLPLEVPTFRTIENLSEKETKELADTLNQRFESLRYEFPALPRVKAESKSIQEAIEQFRELEEEFLAPIANYLDEILPEAFAVVKNTARRLCGTKVEVSDHSIEWNMIHFDVQLIGGMALHKGLISEMQTGEGKTLVATLPVFLNALTGRGVHVITVNDYLAKRDSDWMGALFIKLGLTVGCIQSSMMQPLRSEQYQCDITYGTNSEFGFDYLRDNGMADTKEAQVQREHYFAVIDEVDSVLIDEARTPLIISGPADSSSVEQYVEYRSVVENLVKKQNLYCSELAASIPKLLEEGDEEEAGRAMFKIKLGQPKSKKLARMMQDTDLRRLIDATELTLYQDAQKTLMFKLKEELYFTVDEKTHDADLMEKGREFLSPGDPEAFTLPDLGSAFAELDADTNLTDEERAKEKQEVETSMQAQGVKMHAISQLLKAYCLYEKDVDYVIEQGKVMIVDQQTGRKMDGRRWSDGLHQAVESKERVTLEEETQTYATITIQNYFRLYQKLGGMTGTAETDATEFHDIYGLDVLPIPTNTTNQRIDHNDQVFRSRREKYNAVVAKITECHKKGQPVLVGTASVDASETLARMLKRNNIPHNVLNAKFHEQEADIIAAAGQKGAVTVSTNMAGRGTDIKLGKGVEKLGGLMVIGCERYESRRVDRQLRGRCARQGDKGESQFFISFEDDLMRNFGAAQKMTGMMEAMGLEEGEVLEHRWLNRSIETAQRRVEQRDYTGRKRILEYDDVMNLQRTVVYDYRNEVLQSDNPRELIEELLERVIPHKVNYYYAYDNGVANYPELLDWVNNTFPLQLSMEEADMENRDQAEMADFLLERVKEEYEAKMAEENPDLSDQLERHIILSAIDKLWKEHLYQMDGLRDGVGLRAQGQKDPLVEYKIEAFKLFKGLMDSIYEEGVYNIFHLTTQTSPLQQFLEQNGLPLDMSEQDLEAFIESRLAEQEKAENRVTTVTSMGVGEDEKQTLSASSKKKKKPVKVTLPKRKPIELKGKGKIKKKQNTTQAESKPESKPATETPKPQAKQDFKNKPKQQLNPQPKENKRKQQHRQQHKQQHKTTNKPTKSDNN